MRKDKLTKGIGILIILFIIINFIPTPYYVMSPGIAEELGPIITVENGHKDNIKGSFLLTAVGSQKATIWDYIYVNTFNPDGFELEILSEQLPEGIDMEKYLQMMSDLMEESKMTAEAVALRKLGYEVKVQGEGVEIIEVLEASQAYNELKNGDIIKNIDGQKVEIASEAVDIIRNREVGDKVNIEVIRDNERLAFTVETIELSESPGKPSIGILIRTKNLDYEFPIQVSYDTGNIVGPSAGGMFALEIYNQLVEEDLTDGKRIAGTGTINLEGEIGQIDGIVQKIIAAENAEAEIFIVPQENYEKAKTVETNLKLVPVETFDDAIEFLKSQNLDKAA
ncbi:MAG TPA: PDZ domain-containing protein [Halanaerobiales bacterium]|nr:PDZ domain-containing protein [Halanaerobiales bacterium]